MPLMPGRNRGKKCVEDGQSAVIKHEKGSLVPSLALTLIKTREEVENVIAVDKKDDGSIMVTACMKHRASLAEVLRMMGFAVLETAKAG